MAFLEVIKQAKLDHQKIRTNLGLREKSTILTPERVKRIMLEFAKLYPKKLEGRQFNHKYNVAQQFAVAHVIHELSESKLNPSQREKNLVRQLLNQPYDTDSAKELGAATQLKALPEGRGERIYANVLNSISRLRQVLTHGSSLLRPKIPRLKSESDLEYFLRADNTDYCGDMFANQFLTIGCFQTLEAYKSFLSRSVERNKG